ncbi:MAG: DUF4832 domain-containing protein [Lachnospiraceae bacterium]|nr:DUF4832 domain-containing protein [Lachnospiraceae bacterium]
MKIVNFCNTMSFKKILACIMAASILATAAPVSISCASGKTTTFRPKAKVKKLRKTKVNSRSVRLKWRKTKGATGYQVYRATSRKGHFRKIATTRKNHLTNKKLKPGKTYFYKVRAFRTVKKKKTKGRFSAVLKVRTKKIQQNTTPGTDVPDTASLPSNAPSATTLPPSTASANPDMTPNTTNTPSDNPGATPNNTGTPADKPNVTPGATNIPAANASAAPTTTPVTTPSARPTPTVVTKQYPQNLNYQEITERINNPDQGFYRPIYVRVDEDGANYNKNIVTDTTQLYHLRIDISAFSQASNETADIALTKNALSGIDNLLSYLQEKNKSAIARFVYDPRLSGVSNKEPALDMILQHISQLSAILDQYHDTLTAIEVGLIGPWGEMHTSTMANKDVINALTDAYLNNTTEIPILVRTPKMIYNYLGITMDDIDTYRIESTAKAYRLGLYNDGYLGSSNDLGTYSNREKEVPWLALQNAHLPYGGEVVIPDSQFHNIENCLDEMFQLHLSYLNIEWNNNVIEKWKNSTYTEAAGTDSLYYGDTAFQYIENHMGYRFVLENSILEYDTAVSRFGIDLSLKNVGFGNLNRAMNMTLLLESETGEITSIDAGQFDGREKITFQTDLNLTEGNYKVYLKLDKGNDKYALRFANDLWNEELQANQIGSFSKVNS